MGRYGRADRLSGGLGVERVLCQDACRSLLVNLRCVRPHPLPAGVDRALENVGAVALQRTATDCARSARRSRRSRPGSRHSSRSVTPLGVSVGRSRVPAGMTGLLRRSDTLRRSHKPVGNEGRAPAVNRRNALGRRKFRASRAANPTSIPHWFTDSPSNRRAGAAQRQPRRGAGRPHPHSPCRTNSPPLGRGRPG